MRRWVSDYLLARPRASVSEVHVEFEKSGFDLSRTTLHRIMRGQHRVETVFDQACERVRLQRN